MNSMSYAMEFTNNMHIEKLLDSSQSNFKYRCTVVDLIQMFEGTITTNVKYLSVTNPLYLEFASSWARTAGGTEPWAEETNILSSTLKLQS